MYKTLRSNIFLIGLIILSLIVLAVALRMNFFRYHNFEFGKFDLGNMSQMLWYTLHGKLMWLTDYFGTNAPRWAMSHVDPIILLFLPFFAVIPHSLTLVVSQLILVIFSAILIYLIAELELKSKFAAALFGAAYLFYPALGFLNAWTGYHGVTAAIPFFLGAFYVYEKMHKAQNFTKKGMIAFWILLIITMMGKEQLPLYVFFYGIFVWLFRDNFRTGWKMMLVGLVWFVMAFFVIIPSSAHYRIDGYQKFAQSMGLDTTTARDVESENYFLSRYEGFGESYGEIILNMALHPEMLVEVFFGGDKMDNLRMTFEPVAYIPLAYPPILMFALPDFLINYLTTADGIGTAEIYNHRVSMIIPIMFLSSIYAVALVSSLIKRREVIYVLTLVVLAANVITTFNYQNPVFLWMTQAVEKRLLGSIAFAKTDTENFGRDLEIGESVRLSPLESKDRECAQKVISMIPEDASVSGPDYLGAHLALRETYAIFPALYNEADYVIVDVFARKILTILNLNVSLIQDVVGDIVKDENYELAAGCGNLFVFKNVGPHEKTALLPLQERFVYEEKFDYEIAESLSVVDYTIPTEITKGRISDAEFVYIKRDNNSLEAYVLFMTFINSQTGELYQVANLPSYSLEQLIDWTEDRYYIENIELVLPSYLDSGDYRAFVGISNGIKTRSIYLGDVEVK